MNQGTQLAISTVNNLRQIARAFPSTAPIIQQINDLMREVTARMMAGSETPEPQSPPNAG
jgi:hypothetical protein